MSPFTWFILIIRWSAWGTKNLVLPFTLVTSKMPVMKLLSGPWILKISDTRAFAQILRLFLLIHSVYLLASYNYEEVSFLPALYFLGKLRMRNWVLSAEWIMKLLSLLSRFNHPLRRKRKWDKNINEEINLRAFLICLIHQSSNKINTKNVLFVFIRSNFLKIKNK